MTMRFNPANLTVDPAQLAQQRAAHRQQTAERAERDRQFIAAYGQPGAPLVDLPADRQALSLTLCFDDGDLATDYHNDHAPLSPRFLVLLARPGAETQARARQALALLPPALQQLKWEWHKEKYSMGHGNYLQSQSFPLPPGSPGTDRPLGRGGLVTHAHWEIEFAHNGQLLPHAVFGTSPRAGEAAPPPVPESAAGLATLSINTAKDFVQIHFAQKPEESTLAELRARKFRYWAPTRCWWHKNTQDNRTWAEGFVEGYNQRVGGPAPTPAPAPDPEVALQIADAEAAAGEVAEHPEPPVAEPEREVLPPDRILWAPPLLHGTLHYYGHRTEYVALELTTFHHEECDYWTAIGGECRPFKTVTGVQCVATVDAMLRAAFPGHSEGYAITKPQDHGPRAWERWRTKWSQRTAPRGTGFPTGWHRGSVLPIVAGDEPEVPPAPQSAAPTNLIPIPTQAATTPLPAWRRAFIPKGPNL